MTYLEILHLGPLKLKKNELYCHPKEERRDPTFLRIWIFLAALQFIIFIQILIIFII